jgi:hypothetical protein
MKLTSHLAIQMRNRLNIETVPIRERYHGNSFANGMSHVLKRVLPEISEDSFPEFKAIMGEHLLADYPGWLEERQDWESDDVRDAPVNPTEFRQFVEAEGCLPDMKALIDFATRLLNASINER